MTLGSSPINPREGRKWSEQLRLRRETLQCVVDQCKRGLEILRNADECFDSDGRRDDGDSASVSSSPDEGDPEIAELYDLLKSRLESTNFLDKIGSIHMSDLQDMAAEDGGSWDVVSKVDFWDGCIDGENESDQDAYVLVRQEDVVEGIACFMAAHILSLKQTKDLTPNQLQEALSKTFSVKKKRGKLQKVWTGSKIVYNVASWSATAIGIYQNPRFYRAASVAFCTSCRAVSKLL